jgi:hypothetical protein
MATSHRTPEERRRVGEEKKVLRDFVRFSKCMIFFSEKKDIFFVLDAMLGNPRKFSAIFHRFPPLDSPNEWFYEMTIFVCRYGKKQFILSDNE